MAEVVDLRGVQILRAGGPFFGRGSPAGGDRFDTAYLERLARHNNELADEIHPPSKIGHSREQQLARQSGLADDEGPALGWLRNFRVKGDALLADVVRVPRKFAALIRGGAFPKRSVEISKVTSQRTGKFYDSVITGLAWLGAKAPAVRTLDDIAALFADDQGDEAMALITETRHFTTDADGAPLATETASASGPLCDETLHEWVLDEELGYRNYAATTGIRLAEERVVCPECQKDLTPTAEDVWGIGDEIYAAYAAATGVGREGEAKVEAAGVFPSSPTEAVASPRAPDDDAEYAAYAEATGVRRLRSPVKWEA